MKQIIKTDVLVVGGGMAGWMAADYAVKAGAAVALADKGYIGKCGQSPYATGFYVYDPDSGVSVDEAVDSFNKAGEYLVNRYWARTCIEKSREVKEELASWGFRFGPFEGPGTQLPADKNNADVKEALSACRCPGNSETECGLLGSAKKAQKFSTTFGYQARKHLQDIGVRLYDKVTIVTLMQEGGRVCGAVGIGAEKEDVYVFEAGAVILCTGGSGMKAPGYTCLAPSTGDGERMAYELGANVLGKEFPQPMRTMAENITILGGRGLGQGHPLNGGKHARGAINPDFWSENGEPFNKQQGRNSSYVFAYLDLELELALGKGPVIAEMDGRRYHPVTGAALGMAVRKADGIWPEDHECRSSVPGLFAAGDSLGTMQNGALYMMTGGSMEGCAATGSIAGDAAGREAAGIQDLNVSDSVIDEAVERALAPLRREHGYSPRWVIQLIQNLYMPYYIAYIKEGKRLESALTQLDYIRKQLIPRLKAEDFHELRLAHEADSIALGTEIRLRSALFRTESRGMHFREDYPRRDDANWLAWTRVSRKDGEMVMEKVPVPDEWRQDTELTYRERYPYVFPGEEELN